MYSTYVHVCSACIVCMYVCSICMRVHNTQTVVKPGVRRPVAGAHLVSCNHFDARMSECVYAPEALNN